MSYRHVSDEELLAAVRDANNARMVRKVFRSFRMPREELSSCELESVWRALRTHNPKWGKPLVCSVARYVRWWCLRFEARRRRQADCGSLPKNVAVEGGFAECDALDLLDRLPEPARTVVRMKVFGRYSFRQIARKLRLGPGRAYRVYRWGLGLLRCIHPKEERSTDERTAPGQESKAGRGGPGHHDRRRPHGEAEASRARIRAAGPANAQDPCPQTHPRQETHQRNGGLT